MKKVHPVLDNTGFTLIELVVVMGIFTIVLMIAGNSFKSILSNSTVITKRAETNIEGVVGLEMLRHDLSEAGFGLPTSFVNAKTLLDTTDLDYSEASGIPANSYNDDFNTTGRLTDGINDSVPRAVVAGDNLDGGTTGVLDGSDYLVLKGTTLSRDLTAKRWTYVSTGGALRVWSDNENLANDDKVIVVRRSVVDGKYRNQVLFDPDNSNAFITKYKTTTLNTPFNPSLPGEVYYVYGIAEEKKTTSLRPFNRTDYYVRRLPDIPAGCAPNTGVLYKATLNPENNALTPIPVLDCVADMQVVLGWDLDENGVIDTYSDAAGTTLSGGTGATGAPTGDPDLIRKQLKLVKVYLLVQDGRRDPKYTVSGPIQVGDASEASITRTFSIATITGNDWQNYRWKLYRIVVNPANLSFYQK